MNSFLLVSTYILITFSLLGLFIFFKEKIDRPRLASHAIIFLIVIMLVISSIFRISFYNDWLDSIFAIVLIILGPTSLAAVTKYHTMTSRVFAYAACTGYVVVLLFLGFVISVFGKPLLENTQPETNSINVVKTYQRGGATADCNYEIKRTVQHFIIFEREKSAETKLLTPELHECQ